MFQLGSQFLKAAFIFTPLVLAGCGGSSSSSDSEVNDPVTDATSTGVFLDSPVAGIDYVAGEFSGSTNADGEFEFNEGDQVTFTIGGVSFPPAAAKKVVTPLDMTASGDLNDTVINILRLLQSLDEDKDVSNGIQISEATKTAAIAQSVNFEQSVENFAASTELVNLLSSVNASLVSEADAKSAFFETLAEEGISNNSDLVGAHTVSDENGVDALIVFASSGKLYQAQLNIDDNLGYEVGTYAVVGKEVFFKINLDTNGDAGFNGNLDSEDGSEIGLTIDNLTTTTATFTTTNDVDPDTFSANRVAKTQGVLAGSWLLEDESVVLVFDGDNTAGDYYLIEFPQAADEVDGQGVEKGTYTQSGDTVIITGASADSNVGAGLVQGGTGSTFTILAATEDQVTIAVDGGADAQLVFNRID